MMENLINLLLHIELVQVIGDGVLGNKFLNPAGFGLKPPIHDLFRVFFNITLPVHSEGLRFLIVCYGLDYGGGLDNSLLLGEWKVDD
nr:hypothetical protein Itr_chr12CG20520 [Ipomoea trifida]